MKTIYLDNAATTKVDDAVTKEMNIYLTEKYGNASSSHLLGREAKRAIEESRRTIAKSIGAKIDEVFFTGSGTEANNWMLKGLFDANPGKKHIITTKIEHDCILNACEWLRTQGAEITYLDVDRQGFVNPSEVEKAITPETLVISIIHGNNEVGTIQNLIEIGKICRRKQVLFHTDACQSYTKVPIDVDKMNLDLVTLNAHKIHGPKGVGALYIRGGVKINPLLHGGGQEKGYRSSTENIPGIVGFAKAVSIAKNSHIKEMIKLRDYFIGELLKISGVKINGALDKDRLCNNINVCFGNVDSEAIGDYLLSYGICSSIGSACSSNIAEGGHKKSHVLTAMGLSDLEIKSSMRLSLSKYTTKEEIDYAIKMLKKTLEKLRKVSYLK